MKLVFFIGGARDDLRAFPDDARQEAGFQLARLRRGVEPNDWKPMRGIGAGVREIRIRAEAGAFRVIYVATIGDAVYGLHAFQKKTPQTAKRDPDLAAGRYRRIGRE